MYWKKSKKWCFKCSSANEQAILFDVNIFDYSWKNTGEKAKVIDPLYGQEHKFNVYTVEIDNQIYEFAAGEFSTCVWGFYVFE